MSILKTRGLKKYYGNEPNIVRALDGVELDIEEGEFAAIVGTSGSGKSTLLHMLGGLDNPTEGTIIVAGKDISEMDEEKLTVFRRRQIGFIFQNYNLVPMLNVYENIVRPLELDGKKKDQLYLQKIITMLGLEEKLKNMPNQLSGGQQRGCHREGIGPQSVYHSGRRAYRESGLAYQSGCAWASEGDQQQIEADYCHDYS